MRTVLRVFLIVVLFVAVGFLLLGTWTGWTLHQRSESTSGATGTSGAVDVQRARERGAEVGEKAAAVSHKIQESVAEAALTTKIKAKMALDDSVKARAIDVTTSGTTVTLSGTVRSIAERDRALALARETAGIERVVDHLTIRD